MRHSSLDSFCVDTDCPSSLGPTIMSVPASLLFVSLSWSLSLSDTCNHLHEKSENRIRYSTNTDHTRN